MAYTTIFMVSPSQIPGLIPDRGKAENLTFQYCLGSDSLWNRRIFLL